MADQTDKIAKAYQEWRSAEARYAEELAAFAGDHEPPAEVDKQAALALSATRDRADRARDKFFKRALK